MNILWRSSEKKPRSGDIKIMKNGDIFIRGIRVVRERGHQYWVTRNGTYEMVWYPFKGKPNDPEPLGLNNLRKEYLEKGISIFPAQSSTKVPKTRTVTLNMSVEADRQAYMTYFKCDQISDGIDKVTLSLSV